MNQESSPFYGGECQRYPDTNGNYEPGNVRWATRKQQNNNKRNNIFLTFKETTRTLSEWSEITGISSETISYRLKRGWTHEAALTTPVAHQER